MEDEIEKEGMLARIGFIVTLLFFVTVNGGSDGKGQCCGGYLREYDHAEACYWYESGRCCADNAIYSPKHGEIIGIENARRITEDESSLCQQCFRDIVEC